jgi:hypothetical protein
MVRSRTTGSWIQASLAMAALGAVLTLAGCEFEKEREGDLPDVDVSARGGQLPDYDVEKTREGRLPDVDVDVEGGQLPDYDVDVADVDVGMKKKTFDVPKIRVVVEEEEFQVPYIDIDSRPDDGLDLSRAEPPTAGDDASVSDGPNRETTPIDASRSADAGTTAGTGQPPAAGTTASTGQPPPVGAAGRIDQTVTVRVDAPEARYDLDIQEVYLADDELLVISRLEEEVPSAATSEQSPDTLRDVSDTVVVRTPSTMAVKHFVVGDRVGVQNGADIRFVDSRAELEGEVRTARLLYRAEPTRVMDPTSNVSQVR